MTCFVNTTCIFLFFIFQPYRNMAASRWTVSLNEATPTDINTHIACHSGRRGSVAAIYNSYLVDNIKPLLNFSSLESLSVSIVSSFNKISDLVISIVFFSNLALFKDNIIVTGEFKIHVDVKTDPRSSQFSSLYDSFGFAKVWMCPLTSVILF